KLFQHGHNHSVIRHRSLFGRNLLLISSQSRFFGPPLSRHDNRKQPLIGPSPIKVAVCISLGECTGKLILNHFVGMIAPKDAHTFSQRALPDISDWLTLLQSLADSL